VLIVFITFGLRRLFGREFFGLADNTAGSHLYVNLGLVKEE
jgi:hypothetical protein